jgi:[ribosomal protein S5]-alanine N-acetyltransferase
MGQSKKYDRKKAVDNFGKVMKTFGETVGEIFEDPEFRKKAKEFSQSFVDAAAKVVESHIKDDEVKAKFQNVGKAAQNLGQTLTDHFKSAD